VQTQNLDHVPSPTVEKTNTPWGNWTKVVESVKPTARDFDTLKSVYQKVTTRLLQIFPGAHCTKAGSFGKRTFIKGRREIDIVAYLPNFSLSEARALRTRCLAQLKITFPSCTEKEWALYLSCDGVSVDILLTGTMKQGPLGFLLLKPEDRQIMSCSMATTQLHFFRGQPEMYQDLVRVAKFWRNSINWEEKGNRPSSYLLELLMLDSFQAHTTSTNDEQG
jgi:hypothetical protein